MKILKRAVSALLVLVMVVSMLPVQAFAAEEEAVAELRFYSDCTIDAYTVVSVGKDHKLTFNLGENPYKFGVKFDNPEEIGHVFVSSTVDKKTKKLKAEFNEKTGMFETEGYFDPENKYYEPCNVRVEYAPKASAPAVGSEVDWNALMEHIGADLQGSTVTNTNEGGSSYGQLELAGELAGVTLDYVLEELEPEALSALREEYNSQSGLAAYIVPGLDDEKYYAYLDMSDPSTYIMFLDDGLDVGSKAVSLKLDMMEQGVGDYSKLSEVSQGISNVSTVVGFVGDAYNIHKDMDALRDELDTIEYHDDNVKKAAMDAVDALEADQIAFALLVTAIPIIATGGGASPAAAAIFSGIIGVMSAASDTVYGLRVGGIKDKTTQAEWNSNKAGGQCTDTITWEYDKATRTAIISGTGPMPNYGFNVHPGAPWYNVWGENGRLPVENIFIREGITYIGCNTFWDQFFYDGLKNVSVPKSVEHIGSLAFRDCKNLPEDVLPEGVKILDRRAFYRCGMEKIRLPSTLTQVGDQYYNEGPFYECEELTDVYYPGNVSQWESITGWQTADSFESESKYPITYTIHMHPSGILGDNLTWYFDGVDTLTIQGEGKMADIPGSGSADGDHFVRRHPWERLKNQIGKIVVEEGITEASAGAFALHPVTEEIELPSTLTRIDGGAFRDSVNLKKVTIPKNVSYVGYAPFIGCAALEKIVIEGPVDSMDIRECAALTTVECSGTTGSISFDNCGALKNLEIPYGVRGVGIRNCPSLETVTIPATAAGGYQIFEGCSAVTDIYYGSSETAWENDFGVGEELLPNATVHFTSEGVCGDGLTWDFEEETGVLEIRGKGEMEDRYTWLHAPWYCYASQIKQVIVGEGVTGVSENAFGFVEEGDTAYSNLTSIELPKTLLTIDDGAFAACPALPSIEIPQGVTTIGNEAFKGNKALTSIELPDSVTQLGEAAFKNCTALETVRLSESLEIIEKETFYNCTALTGIELPDSVTELGFSVFYNCAALKDVKLSKNLKNIPGDAFRFCGSLGEIDIPDGVENIGSDAFEGCVSLSEITIPASVASIGNTAFRYCSGLTKIIFQGDAPAMAAGGWSGGTFQGVTADAYYPAGNATWTEDKLQDYGGTIMWHTDDNMDESGLTEKYIQDQIDAGYKNVSVDGIIKLQNDFTIPKGIIVSVSSASTLVIPDGKTLTVQAGKLSAWEGGAWGYSKIIVEKGGILEVITDESNNGDLGVGNQGNSLIVEEGGLLKVNGKINADNGAIIDMQGSYEIGTDEDGKPWHVRISYADTEKGYVQSVIKGIPLKDQTLVWNVTTTEQWEELVAVLNEDTYGSYDIRIQTPVTLDQELTVPKLCTISGINETNYMEITESGTLRSFGEIMAYSNNALKNNGTIEVYNRIYIAGAMPNAGSIHVNAGGFLDIRNDGYVTNTGTVNINESGKVEVGRDGTFQNDGEVYVNAGGNLEIVNTEWAKGTWLGKEAVINGGSVGHTHDYSQYVQAPTCTEQGYTVHSCSCGDAYATDLVEPLGHSYGEGVVTTQPGCETEGVKTYTCQRDSSHTYTETIPAAHTEEIIPGKAPTCSETGLTEGKRCALCDKVIQAQESVSMVGHEYVDGVCKFCGEQETVEHVHAPVTDAAVSATCTEDGLTEGSHCADCGEILTAQEVIKATGHSYGDWYVTTEATTEEYGEERRDCGNCGEYETRVLEKLPTEDTPTSGSCGDQMTWEFDAATGTLTIVGDGEMYDFAPNSLAKSSAMVCPWAPFRKDITTIILVGAVTRIGDYTFCGCENLYGAFFIPESVTQLGAGAFQDCSNLDAIVFAGNAPTEIGTDAFKNVTAAITYPLDDPTWTSDVMKDYGGDLDWGIEEDTHAYKLGDVSHDGKINAKDSTLILQKVVGVLKDSAKFCEACADVSGDGKLNAKDSTLILQVVVGLRDSFPAEEN